MINDPTQHLTLGHFRELAQTKNDNNADRAVRLGNNGTLEVAEKKEVKDITIATISRKLGGDEHVGGQTTDQKNQLATRFSSLLEAAYGWQRKDEILLNSGHLYNHMLTLGDIANAFKVARDLRRLDLQQDQAGQPPVPPIEEGLLDNEEKLIDNGSNAKSFYGTKKFNDNYIGELFRVKK